MSHEHTHEHSHIHEHEHPHEYEYTHAHTHSVASSPEEAEALLKYMLDHNQHHAEELHDLAHCFEAEIADLVHDAVDKLQESNDLMEQALALLSNAV